MPEITVPPVEAGTQQQITDRQILVRLVALMLDRNLPTPTSLTARSDFGSVQIRLVDGDQDAVRVWAAALGLRKPTVTDGGGTPQFLAGDPASLLGDRETIVHAFLARREAEPPLADSDAEDAAKIVAAADKPWFDADEPRVWRCTVQADRAEPVGAPTVVDGDGDLWTVVDPDALVCVWTSEGREPEPLQWERLLDLCGELTEVVPPAQDEPVAGLREEYGQAELDQDRNPTEVGFQEWLRNRGGAR